MKNYDWARWIPALVMMAVIFWFSSQPGSDLPNFDWADRLVKKSGHVLGYALLAVSYRHAFRRERGNRWLAWIFAISFAFTDEFHQSFVPGRHPSLWDVLIFDNFGTLIGLLLASRVRNRMERAG